jgi:3-oxoacyl-[acyl-carrier protein] reductase
MDLRRVALVTGGSRGLGAAIATVLGRAGFGVAVNYLKGEAGANEVAQAAGDAVALRANVEDEVQVRRMADEIGARWGRLDVLVNNAGISRDSLLVRLSEKDWDDTLGINLKGSFNTTRVFAPMLRDSGGGHVVNVSSRSGFSGNAGQSAYSASKAALLGLTCSAAVELAQYDIRVNAVLPGYMPTDMGAGAGTAMERARGESLLKRLSEPDEVASFILWLVGTRAITGQMFSLDSRSFQAAGL